MQSAAPVRQPHPCLDRSCGHPETDHVLTPELAGSNEVIVFCSTCRHHETRRLRTWFKSLASEPSVGS